MTADLSHLGTAAVDQYLAGLPDDQRAALERLRETILRVVPDAVEAFAYGMPGYRYRKKPLAYFSAWKKHCALYGQDPSLLSEEEAARFPAEKGTIKFTPDQPLPDELVERLIRARIRAIES